MFLSLVLYAHRWYYFMNRNGCTTVQQKFWACVKISEESKWLLLWWIKSNGLDCRIMCICTLFLRQLFVEWNNNNIYIKYKYQLVLLNTAITAIILYTYQARVLLVVYEIDENDNNNNIIMIFFFYRLQNF